MNNIIIENNNLKNYTNEYLIIKDNSITFLKNNEYNITYINSTNINITYNFKPNITIKIFIFSQDNKLQITETYNLEKNTNLELSKFYSNYQIEENITVNLNGENSFFKNNFSSISHNKENYHLIINHNNNYTKSIISNKCIANTNSDITFTIDSILQKGNQDCLMDQTTKILTLGECNTKINPNMFIEEDSVEAKHGSVISSFNEEEIFYLTSRGIPQEEAIYLLIKGFIFSNLNLNMENKALVYDCINNIRR